MGRKKKIKKRIKHLKREEQKKKGRMNRHHILPKSRIMGGYELNEYNIVKWNVEFHKLWHILFRNMTVDEIHQFIDIVCRPDTVWNSTDISRLIGKIISQNPTYPRLCRICDRKLVRSKRTKCDICGEKTERHHG